MSPVHKTRSHSAKKALKKAIKSNRSGSQKAVEKHVMNAIVNTVMCKMKEIEKDGRSKRLPNNYFLQLVDQYKPAIPTLTVKAIQNAVDYQKRKERTSTNKETIDDANHAAATKIPPADKKIGRPTGTSKEQMRVSSVQKAAAMNEVTLEVEALRKVCKVVNDDAFQRIVNETKTKHNLPVDFEIKKNTVLKRISREKTVLEGYETKGGHVSPLLEIEPSIVQLVLCMSKFRQALTSVQIMDLVNSCIQGTEYQQKLIEYKKTKKIQQDVENMGKVGLKYVAGFMKRWEHIIDSSRPRKFELDRSKWALYSNFKEMYDAVEEAMLDCGVAERLDPPQWMDKEGNIVESQADAFGMPCTIRITHPDLCLVGDEVGGNTSQKGDGHIGGKKVVGERGCVSQVKASKKEKKFTVIGLTALNGEPVMCIIIIEGKERKIEVEMGLDYSVPWDGSPDDADFILKNTGPGKRFPGGPTCHFRGKDIPCLVRMSESGGINEHILVDIFKTLDHYEVFHDARKQGKTPLVMLDGHDSRFRLPFVQYINNENTKYCVTIGVPYGTSYWQVGDSVEQNGCFKMATYRAKDQILAHREKNPMGVLGILPSDIIIIVNEAWERSFARVRTNKKTIAERGWYPFNRNVLLHKDIRATMSEQDHIDEVIGMEVVATNSQQPKQSPSTPSSSTQSSSTLSTLTPQYDSVVSRSSLHKPVTLNFGTGMALHVLKTIVSENDMNKAREAIKKEQSIGEAEKHLLKDVKKISAANIVKCGTYVIGKNVADEIMERNAKRLQDEAERKLRRQKREEELELKRKLAIEDKQRKEKEMEEREKREH